MKIENYRYIKSLELPIEWTENQPAGGFAPRIVRSFSPPDNAEVKMKLFYRGLPMDEESGKAFRKAIKLAPRLMYDHTSANKTAAADAQLLRDLAEVLGNVGHNQITNTQTGSSGPPFKLDRLDALVWNDKPLLAARGWFCNAETGKGISAFCGFFIDANPKDAACNVEEIFLEAPREDLYLSYLPVFEECMRSIEWLSK